MDVHAKYAPFARRDCYGPMACSIPRAEKLRLALLWCTLLPLAKALAALVALCSFSVVCSLARAAPPRVRQALLPPLAHAHVRAVLFCCGFLWIRRRRVGPPPKRGVTPVAVVSNHVSWSDILVHMAECFPSFVAKATIRKLPLVGVISESMGCIFVERETRAANGTGAAALVAQRLREKAADPAAVPPLLLFPEGTTTNGAFLLPFKTGAFLTGAPVQPVLLRYGDNPRRFSPAWETVTAPRHFFLTFSQLYQPLEVVYLPVYEPSAEEAKDPALYAAGVRAAMLRASGLAPSELTLADKRAYQVELLADWAARNKNKAA